MPLSIIPCIRRQERPIINVRTTAELLSAYLNTSEVYIFEDE